MLYVVVSLGTITDLLLAQQLSDNNVAPAETLPEETLQKISVGSDTVHDASIQKRLGEVYQ
ncbi:MAG: hypothetical protein KDD33_13900, partial [Bdellovibrionales bacterium]|nr:hypothetical protein [Bdellovibrionales bacterium]